MSHPGHPYLTRNAGHSGPVLASARRSQDEHERADTLPRRLLAHRCRSIDTLVLAGILVETTGKRRDRAFAYFARLHRLRDGTELTPP